VTLPFWNWSSSPTIDSATYRPGADFATTDQLGYRYLNYCFILPPFRFWEVVHLDLAPRFVVDEMKTAHLLVKAARCRRDLPSCASSSHPNTR
jgi:hypothetical protein